MVVGILLAGGIGLRMGANVPKQFLEIKGKPVVQYPLEIMEKHPMIDAIEIVCVDSFIDEAWRIVKEAGISKVKWITAGGATCQESIKNGLDHLKGKIDKEDIIMIHMSSYPLASAEIIGDCIQTAVLNGNSCAARPINYSVLLTEDKKTANEHMDRNRLMLCTCPMAFHFGECSDIYDRAFAEGKGIFGNVWAHTLFCDYGKTIYFSKDSETNFKVTTLDDIKIMETYLDLMNEE